MLVKARVLAQKGLRVCAYRSADEADALQFALGLACSLVKKTRVRSASARRFFRWRWSSRL